MTIDMLTVALLSLARIDRHLIDANDSTKSEDERLATDRFHRYPTSFAPGARLERRIDKAKEMKLTEARRSVCERNEIIIDLVIIRLTTSVERENALLGARSVIEMEEEGDFETRVSRTNERL